MDEKFQFDKNYKSTKARCSTNSKNKQHEENYTKAL